MRLLERPFENVHLDDPFLQKLVLPIQWLGRYHRYKVYGLERIPREGRVLLVINHSFATYDGILLGAAVLVHVGRHPVGLADHNFFKIDAVARLATRLGLVEASHTSAEQALEAGKLVAVAPGGMRESLRPKHERYQVLWQKRRGFVKLALRTRTPIVLAACPQADELYDVYPNILTKWLYKNVKLPFVLLKGWGPTLIPKPIQLFHLISKPIQR
jgi:1-acyl-sn-glycerol-3-phosphate acyltransferase